MTTIAVPLPTPDVERTRDAISRRGASSLGVFLHLPKTGGLTVESVIRRVHRRGDLFVTPSESEAAAAYDELSSESRRRLRFLTGHVQMSTLQSLGRPLRIATILRDPVTRTVSNYRHLLRHPNVGGATPLIERGMSLEESLDVPAIHNDNVYTRWLSGLEDPLAPAGVGEVPYDYFERAKRVLETEMVAVGITERFDDSLLLIADGFGWPMPWYHRRNVSRGRSHGTSLDSAVVRRIRRMNEMDCELYEIARRRFESDLRWSGLGSTSRRSRFRRWQPWMQWFARWTDGCRRAANWLERRTPAGIRKVRAPRVHGT